MEWPLDINRQDPSDLGLYRTVDSKNGSRIHHKRLDGVSPSHRSPAIYEKARRKWGETPSSRFFHLPKR